VQSKTIESEMQQFLAHIAALRHLYSVKELFPYTYIIAPARPSLSPSESKDIALTFFAVIHGNEVAGIAILNKVLAEIAKEDLPLKFPLALALGNYPALKSGVRYVDKDLNRSFGGSKGSAWELTRAEELASVLLRSSYLIDFHQTSQPSKEPFFIFPYSQNNVKFARALSARQAVVTHWHGGFSQDGMATDEFLTRHGGVGVTVETGQNGFFPEQITLGAQLAKQAVAYVERKLQELRGPLPATSETELLGDNLYTWAHVQEFPRGVVILRPGLVNFQPVEKGEHLGTCDGVPLLAAASGKLLFPKYVDPALAPAERPAELLRIIRPLSPSELPQDKEGGAGNNIKR
jgi:succinylglutamate desuccinylase